MNLIDLKPQQEERLSFERFVNLSEAERSEIAEIELVPPTLGREGFGHIVVKYRAPKFVRLILNKKPQRSAKR